MPKSDNCHVIIYFIKFYKIYRYYKYLIIFIIGDYLQTKYIYNYNLYNNYLISFFLNRILIKLALVVFFDQGKNMIDN